MGYGPSPDTWVVRSVAGTHFTGVINQNAYELEDLGQMLTPHAVISTVTVWSEQNLDWDLMFFRTGTGQPHATIDSDRMIDWVSFTSTDGVQLGGASHYRYASSGLNIRIPSDDGHLHVMLVNRNAVAKLASGSGGNFVVEFSGPKF